jgi:hypothetical protein
MQLDLLDWQQPAPALTAAGKFVPWPQKDVDKLVELYVAADVPDIETIAAKLGKTYSCVASQASRMGLAFTRRGAAAKMRKCIVQCGRSFWSEHVGNRICPTCKRGDLMECA